MVTKSEKPGSGKIKKVKVLQLNKETVKNLTPDQARKVKGASFCPGAARSTGYCTAGCPKTIQTGK